LVEALHLAGVALLDPPLERGVVLPLQPLQERGLELPDATAAGRRVQPVRLLERVEPAQVRHPRVAPLHLVRHTQDRRYLHQRRRHHLAVEYRLPQVPRRLRP
ncbi:Os02g0832301, partial [Oryza sativa Japonica Group]